MAILKLVTFGALRLVRSDDSLAEVPTNRAQALLLFLVLHRGNAIHRESICTALWPESDEVAARAQLRKALWRLRTAAGSEDASPLICNEYQIGLDVARIDVDVWRFTEAMRGLELKDDASLSVDDAEVLLRALDLNRDDFGRGVYDEWLLSEQQVLREARVLAMGRLAAFHRVKGHMSQAIVWARRALKLDPLREHLHMSIIECLQAMGDRALALRQYRDCEEVLLREVGVAPSAQIRRLLPGLAEDR